MSKFDYDSLEPEMLDRQTREEVIKSIECDISWAENSLTRISRFSVAQIENTGAELKRLKSLRKRFVKKR